MTQELLGLEAVARPGCAQGLASHIYLASAGKESQCPMRSSIFFLGEQAATNAISLERIALHVFGKPLSRCALPTQQRAEKVPGWNGRVHRAGGIRHASDEPP